MGVGYVQSAEALFRTYDALFPGKRVRAFAFPFPVREANMDASNEYVARCAREDDRLDALLTPDPRWDREELRRRVGAGPFIGFKPYPDLVSWKDSSEVTIADYVTEPMLELSAELGLFIVLHIPRAERLRDPVNISELRRLSRDHPDVPVIIAHVGRSYAYAYAEAGLPQLADCGSLLYDISAVMRADVLELLLRTVGPQRVLYGSDLPILAMRGWRTYDGDRYINHAIGDYVWGGREDPAGAPVTATFYLYHELMALREAAEAVGLTATDVEAIMRTNADRLRKRGRSPFSQP
jgi:hypothetical protein